MAKCAHCGAEFTKDSAKLPEGSRLPVAFVTGASGAGKSTFACEIGASFADTAIIHLDRIIKDAANGLDRELQPENRRFTADPYSYDQWEQFLVPSHNFEKAVARFREVLNLHTAPFACLVEGNHFFLSRIEEAVLVAVLTSPGCRERDAVVRKFLLDCDASVVFDQLLRANRPKDRSAVNDDVERFHDVMANRGYEPHSVNTLGSAVERFFDRV